MRATRIPICQSSFLLSFLLNCSFLFLRRERLPEVGGTPDALIQILLLFIYFLTLIWCADSDFFVSATTCFVSAARDRVTFDSHDFQRPALSRRQQEGASRREAQPGVFVDKSVVGRGHLPSYG